MTENSQLFLPTATDEEHDEEVGDTTIRLPAMKYCVSDSDEEKEDENVEDRILDDLARELIDLPQRRYVSIPTLSAAVMSLVLILIFIRGAVEMTSRSSSPTFGENGEELDKFHGVRTALSQLRSRYVPYLTANVMLAAVSNKSNISSSSEMDLFLRRLATEVGATSVQLVSPQHQCASLSNNIINYFCLDIPTPDSGFVARFVWQDIPSELATTAVVSNEDEDVVTSEYVEIFTGLTAALVLLVLSGSYWLLHRNIVFNLAQLSNDMAYACSLELEQVGADAENNDDSGDAGLYEFRVVQLTLRLLVENLKLFQLYLPEYVILSCAQENENNAVIDIKDVDATVASTSRKPSASAVPTPTRTGSIAESNSDNTTSRRTTRTGSFAVLPASSVDDSSSGGATVASRVAAGLHHSRKRLAVSLAPRRVTVLHLFLPEMSALAMERPRIASTISVAVSNIVLGVVDRFEGVVLQMSSERVVATWNGHRSCVGHERQACRAAMEIAGLLRYRQRVDIELEGLRWIAALSCGVCAVGSTGSSSRRSATTVGPAMLEALYLVEMTPQLDGRVLATADVMDASSSVVRSRPVDCVRLSEHGVRQDTCFVYELLSEDISDDILGVYNTAFSHMQRGKYDEAVDAFVDYLTALGREDPVATRLYRQCTVASVLPTPYVRPHIGWELHEAASGIYDMEEPAAVAGIEAGYEDDIDTLLAMPSVLQRVLHRKSTTVNVTHIRHARATAKIQQQSPPSASVGVGQQLPSPPSPNPFDADPDGDSVGDTSPNDVAVTTASAALVEDERMFVDEQGRAWKRSDRNIGTGATASVYSGMGENGALVAMKCVNLNKIGKQAQQPRRRMRGRGAHKSTEDPDAAFWREVHDILQEVQLLSELRHHNIVGYLSSCVVRGQLVIVMEYVPGGSLHSLLREFGTIPLTSTQRYVRDVVRGLAFLHANGVVHRDVKPHNVLLMIDGQCKLTDFGASARISGLASNKDGLSTTASATNSGEDTAAPKRIHGTPLYMSPEQASGDATSASDVWGVGVLTYQLLTGKVPYDVDLTEPESFNAVTFMKLLIHDVDFMPVCSDEVLLDEAAKSFLSSIFVRDPSQRPSAAELLSHPFLL
eukprot:PhM_4_TR3087/c1_g1_i6/m.53866/K17533/MAP3K19, YSK4; mitogen-activated protein kinase kinase kinase 19